MKQRVVDTPVGPITLRAFESRDVEALLEYLYDSPEDFLTSIGFDPDQFPGRVAHSEGYHRMIRMRDEKPEAERSHLICILELDDQAVGMVALVPDDGEPTAHAHFHIWNPRLRGRGLGSSVLRTALDMLMKAQSRDEAFIEPHKDNLPMNQLMKRCGFRFLEEVVFEEPMTLSFPANRYLIRRSELAAK